MLIKANLLLSQMKLKNVSTKDLADAQGWSMTTAYRKINGKTEFTRCEIQTTVNKLDLEASIANEIFFTRTLAFRQKQAGAVDG